MLRAGAAGLGGSPPGLGTRAASAQGCGSSSEGGGPRGSEGRGVVEAPTAAAAPAAFPQVWQRLSGASEKMESTVENYRILVTKETPDEKVQLLLLLLLFRS